VELQGKQTPILHNLTLNTCIWSNAFLLCLEVLNIGQPCLECQYYKGQLWYEERAEKFSTSKQM